MIDELLQEQAALYALDLLVESEKREFEQRLHHDEALRQLVSELQLGRDGLALQLPVRPPSRALKHRILETISQEARPTKLIPFPTWLPWAIAACLALCAVIFYGQWQTVQTEVACLRTQYSPDQWQAVSLRTASDQSSEATATVLWNHAMVEGKLTVTKLPPHAAGQDYQLWVICSVTKHPVNAGIVRLNAQGQVQMSFRPDAKIGRAAQFCISLEKAGGDLTPHGPIVLAGVVL